MRSIFRATAILGSASVINVVIGLVSSKVTAVLLGPSGFGLMALLQAFVSLAAMLAGLGIPAALVRSAARAIADADADQEVALRRAAFLISACAGLATILLIIVFRHWLSELAFGTSSTNWLVFVAPAVAFSLMSALQSAVLNARRRVGDLARISILSAAISLAPTIVLVWMLRERGVAPAVLANMFVAWLVSYFYYQKAERDVDAGPMRLSRAALRSAAGGLVGFGIPYMASLAVGTGVLTLVPILVLHALGPGEVGLFRAASSIAVNYLGILLAAMAQDYFPRVAGAPDSAGTLNDIINQQLRLVLLIGGPVILGMLAVVPYLVPILYSHKFVGAVDLLEWQLIGDLFKFAAWTMSFVVMVRLGGRTFFFTELIAGGVLLVTSWFGMQRWGLPGLGVAFVATSACGCALGWAVLWRSIRLRWTRENAALFLLLAAGMALIRALPNLGLGNIRTPVAAAFAALAGSYSVVTIWRELGGWQGIRDWRTSE
jgi:antigen flippase